MWKQFLIGVAAGAGLAALTQIGIVICATRVINKAKEKLK